ncbi:MAG: capsule assembly Wzi family protein [Tannerellaceae bacterium]|nr:capsule assembly Wzi family protein [Tannerellaceae bacterium]
MFASGASSDYTPFWLVSNRNGIVPLAAGNGYLSAGMFYNQSFDNGIRLIAGADMAAVTPRYRNILIRQLYAGIAYRSLILSAGSREQHSSLWDKDLSSGDMVLSSNARPIPEIKISMPEYTPFPGTKKWLYLKGSFSVGRSFDTDYLDRFTETSKATYVKDILWHYKSIFFRFEAPENRFPLSFELGLQHGAQWAGVSTNPRIGEQPRGLSDFVRVILGMGGGDGATASDSINVLGNQYGSYDMKLTYKGGNWSVQAYHQRYFEDKSGTIFGNGWDGLWGVQLSLHKTPWLHKILVERIDTRNQTGPFHFINFDHDKYPGVGGGGDNYYNNGEYTTGLSYFNRSVGSPLLPSPEYNTDGAVGFKNTRVLGWHLGLSGDIFSQLSYRILFSVTDSWGVTYRPFFPDSKTGASGLLEITYRHPHLEGWTLTGSVSADRGDILGKEGIGFGLCISKRGILPIKPRQ